METIDYLEFLFIFAGENLRLNHYEKKHRTLNAFYCICHCYYRAERTLGQLVLSGNTHNGTLWVDLPETGFYIVKAEDSIGNVVTKKIIVTR